MKSSEVPPEMLEKLLLLGGEMYASNTYQLRDIFKKLVTFSYKMGFIDGTTTIMQESAKILGIEVAD